MTHRLVVSSFVALSSVLFSCGDPTLSVFVELQTDLVPGIELDRVRTELLTELPTIGSDTGSRVNELMVGAEDDFAGRRRVAEFGDLEPGEYVIRTRALLEAAIVASRVLRVEVRENTGVLVVLTRSCRGVSCPGSGDSPAAVSCVGGTCREPECVSGREEACPPRECTIDGDCTVPPDACTQVRCVDGLCLRIPDDDACDGEMRCLPDSGCVDTSECVALTEICNGADDDCDEAVDEDFDLSTDVAHCGSCDTVCSEVNAVTACADGTCDFTCRSGFADCNGSAADGCETSISSAMSCGGCDLQCEAPTPLCESSGTAAVCASDCGALTPCGTSCVDTSSDPQNCGRCENECPAPIHATGICSAGACAFSCDEGFEDCDGDPATGCETNLASDVGSCGRCDVACSVMNGTPICNAGTCDIGSCAPMYGDCNGMVADGCEASLNTVTDCGGCGMACSILNAAATCTFGVCRIESCNAGFGDCDGSAVNGCETDLANDRRNCNICGNDCGAGARCEAGACVSI